MTHSYDGYIRVPMSRSLLNRVASEEFEDG